MKGKFGGSSMLSPLIMPGENARIDIQRSLDGGALLVVSEVGKPPRGFNVSKENCIGCGLAFLQAAGIPIEETYRRQQALAAERKAS